VQHLSQEVDQMPSHRAITPGSGVARMNHRHLTEAVRYPIQTLRDEGNEVLGIARRAGCHASTIRRELISVIRRVTDGGANTVMAATRAGLYPWQDAFPGSILRIAYDNGSEFAEHMLRNIARGCTSYFARPYASWERGTNESANGLIRQYAPQRTDLGKLSDADVQRIADKLNDRPRKVLGFPTPRGAFDESLAQLTIDRGKTQEPPAL